MGRIVKAEIFKVPYNARGYRLSYGALNEIFAVVLRLSDGDGRVGWGEANPQQPFTVESADDVIAVLKERLIPILFDEENAEPAYINEVFDREKPDDDLMAKGAVDIALMDLEGKRLGVPVAQLLGTVVRRSMAVSYPLSNGTAEDDIRVINKALEDGYVHYMLKMGAPEYPVAGEIERVSRIRDYYGNRITIKVDANTGWSLDQARLFQDGVVKNYLAYIEQPIDKYDIAGLSELQTSTEELISADESLTGMSSAKKLIENRAARNFSLKISKNGGILKAQRIAQLAEEHGISCYPNSMIEGGITQAASLHLTATLNNLVKAGGSFRSVLRLDGDVTNFHTFIRKGVVYLPEGPGLGINVDETKLRATAVASFMLEA